MDSTNRAAKRVVEQRRMVWRLRVAVQRHTRTGLDWQESSSSFADACSQAGRWRCESCHDLMTYLETRRALIFTFIVVQVVLMNGRSYIANTRMSKSCQLALRSIYIVQVFVILQLGQSLPFVCFQDTYIQTTKLVCCM